MNLIDKDALVSEIKAHISDTSVLQKAGLIKKRDANQKIILFKSVLSLIDTLEVKEVDFITPEEIKKICTIYDNLNQERKCATVLYNSDETFFNHVLMEYKTIAQNIKEEVKKMEVKEVDFGTEVYKYMDEHFRVYDDGNQTLQNKDKHTLIGRVDAENIAKHFFELGLKAKAMEE